MPPETRYAKSGDVHIAYQVLGDGPQDLVIVPGWVSNIEEAWSDPDYVRYLQHLASFSRVIRFDKRGTGMSDRVPHVALPTLEQRMDDVRAVMDAVVCERAALLGHSEGGPMAVLFAATYPERTTALILHGAFARRLWTADYPWGPTAEQRERLYEAIEKDWGTPAFFKTFNPKVAEDPRRADRVARQMRQSASPGAALALARMNAEIDVRDILPAVRVPTLVINAVSDPIGPVGGGRFMADRIPGARFVELHSDEHNPAQGDQRRILDEIEEFLTGTRQPPEPDRVLATVLLTDIVASTQRVAELGDRHWRELLTDHDSLVLEQLAHARGRAVKHTGDGFLATFDGPARAIRCAAAIRDAVQRLGIEIRAGLHTGECELIGDDVGGIAVHIGQRVSALAEPNEVLVSSTVKDLVAGSALRFEDRGTHILKGVPGEWRLFRACS